MAWLSPVVTPDEMRERDRTLREYLTVLEPGVDYDQGGVDGLFDKPSLLQPGAEKLAVVFGLRLLPRVTHRVEDLAGDQFGEPFLLIEATTDAYRDGELVGAGMGLATSLEPSHRYRWVDATEIPLHLAAVTLPSRVGSVSEPLFAVERAETGGKWGKPAEYWQQFTDAIAAGKVERSQRPNKTGKMTEWVTISSAQFRVPNPDVMALLNSIEKMAVKRSKVAAVISTIGGLSALFTQDVEDMPQSAIQRRPSAPKQDQQASPSQGAGRSRAAPAGPQQQEAPAVPGAEEAVGRVEIPPAVWRASGLSVRMVKEDGKRRAAMLHELSPAELVAIVGIETSDDDIAEVVELAATVLDLTEAAQAQQGS